MLRSIYDQTNIDSCSTMAVTNPLGRSLESPLLCILTPKFFCKKFNVSIESLFLKHHHKLLQRKGYLTDAYRWCSIKRAASSVTTASKSGCTACESSVKRATISSRLPINSREQQELVGILLHECSLQVYLSVLLLRDGVLCKCPVGNQP
jgi:hypothetical protein